MYELFCFMHGEWKDIKAGVSDDMSRHFNLIDRVDRVIELELVDEANRTGKAPQCGAGCSFCCKSERIEATKVEICFILHEIENLPKAKAGRVVEQIKNSKATQHVSRMGRGSPCSMLIDDKCSVYAVRPISCRGYLSSSVQECKQRFDGTSTMVSGFAQARFVELVVNELYEADGVDLKFEINSILKILFEDNALRSKWMSGDTELIGENFLKYFQEAHSII